MRLHTPTPRLRNARIGATVTLHGYRRSMYIGKRDEDGYSYLWMAQENYDKGQKWMVMAAGSHPVEITP